MKRRPGVVSGAVGGAVATGAMSLVMVASGKLGIMGKQPPTAITERFLDTSGTGTDRAGAVAPVLHLAFGAASGAAFVPFRRALPGVPALALGSGYGLAIWAMSYVGWIPALGILPAPDKDRPGRAVTMLVAHLVYGLVLGASDNFFAD